MGSRAKRRSKHKLKSKKDDSKSVHCHAYTTSKPTTKNISRETKSYEASDNIDCPNLESHNSLCYSDMNVVCRKMFPISISSQHDFEADPRRVIHASRNSGTRSDELEILVFQSSVDEFAESTRTVSKDCKIKNSFFPTLLTEMARIEQDLLQKLASIKHQSCQHSEACELPDQSVPSEELSNLKNTGDTPDLNFASQEDEQGTTEEATEEILIYYRPESHTVESSEEQYEFEIPDKPMIQNCDEKKEANDILDLVVDSMLKKSNTNHDEEAQVTKSKRKRANKKKNKKKKQSTIGEELSKTISMEIWGTKLKIDVTKDEQEIMDDLNLFAKLSIGEPNDIDRYILFLKYHCYIYDMFAEKPAVLASLKSKLKLKNSTHVHQIGSKDFHYMHAVLHCINLGRRTSDTDRIQQYFNEFMKNSEYQLHHDYILTQPNEKIVTYFRVMAEKSLLHPIEWYQSLRELSREIEKTRPFPGPTQAYGHWTDGILYCTCSDELMPIDSGINILISNYLNGSDIYRQAAWYHWQSIRRFPWINTVATFELSKIMEKNPNLSVS